MTISQNPSKLIKNLIFSFCFLLTSLAWAETLELMNSKKQKVTLRLALSRDEQQKGLSGIKPADFKTTEAMLFVNDSMGPRRFWMPDTHFNLDIIFLNNDLKIVGIETNVPAHPGTTEPPAIYRTKTYQAQFVLETKHGAEFSKNLKVGETLKWLGKTNLSEIVLKTRRLQ